MSFLKRFSFFFLPSVFQAALSILILPFTTAILGPEEYGIFAIVLSLTALGTVIAGSGAGFLFSSHYTEADIKEKRLLVSTVVITGVFLSFIFSGLVIFLWDLIVRQWSVFAHVSLPALYLGLVTLVFSLPWVFAIDILTLEGRARHFAGTLIFQSCLSAAATLVTLYVFDQGLLSLFWGSFLGSVVTFFGAVSALKDVLRMNFSRKWFSSLWKVSSIAVPASILESFHVLLERSVLSIYVGLGNLGIYTHSQQYRSLVLMPVKAAARTVWPETLSEAREEISPVFPKTRAVWDALYLGITACGIVFATFGRDIIALLTHGKFSDASVFATLWMVYLLIQNMGKPHTGVLWSRGHGRTYSAFQIGALAVGIAALFLLVPSFGLYGAFSALLIQMLTFRIFLQWHVRKIAVLPFQDGWVIFGSAVILFTLGISQYWKFSSFQNFLLLIGMFIVMGIAARDILRKVILRLAKRSISR